MLRFLFAIVLGSCGFSAIAASPVEGASSPETHVWEKQELTFTAANSYPNPYTDVIVWVDLVGPNFKKRVYGFWNGGPTFVVRVLAPEPGTWTWTSGSSPADAGLANRSGSFTATAWNERELAENPLRRGMIRATANGHALEHPDGRPYFLIGDTWFALAADRFKWKDDGDRVRRPPGVEASFQDYVQYRKAQGYNFVCVIAAFPNWSNDGQPYRLNMTDSDKTPIRFAWREFGTESAKNMDNEGGKPFAFPGKIPGFEDVFPDVDRINPEYFKYLDRKIDYLNHHGFVPFIEVSRRDCSLAWKKYHGWPDSYARFMQYIFARYQANNTVLAPVHLDIIKETVMPEDFTAAVDVVFEKFGPPPFGTLLSANSNPSTFTNWGNPPWLTLHQTGNRREHTFYWYLTEIYHLPQPKPAFNGEPYYAGYKDKRGLGGEGYRFGAEGGSERDDLFCRSGAYGSFLSGGLAGHVYGAEGIWGSDIEPEAPTKMWDAFQWRSGAQMQHLRTFALSLGKKYQQLVPLADLVMPNKNQETRAYEGWAYCARTPDKNDFLLYFENEARRAEIHGAKMNSYYRATWFAPRDGTWSAPSRVRSNPIGVISPQRFPAETMYGTLPAKFVPDRYKHNPVRWTSEGDWGLRLEYEGPAPHTDSW